MEIYVSLAFLSALSLSVLAWQMYRLDIRREYQGFLPVMISAAVWSLFSAFWLLTSVEMSELMSQVSFLGIISLPVFLLLFAFDFAEVKTFRKKTYRYLFWVIPGVNIILMLTNSWHGLFWSEVFPAEIFPGVFAITFEAGPFYLLHSYYSYLIIIVALALMFIALRRRKAMLAQYLLLPGIIIPLSASMLYVFGVTVIDLTPLVLAFAVLAFGLTVISGIYGANMQELQKLQHKTVEMNLLYELVVRISERLIHTDTPQIGKAIDDVLAELGRFNKVDRVYIFEYDKENDEVNNTFEWCNNGITPEIENLKGIPFDFVPRWRRHFTNNEYVYIPSVKDLPDDPYYEHERGILLPQGIKSLIVVPMYHAQEFVGFTGFDSVRMHKSWEPTIISLLKMTADIIAGSILRAKYEEALIREKQNAEAANRAKTEFLANMSHELRTPLNAILGFTGIIRDQLDNEDSREQVQMVLSSGNALLRLINDLLDFSKAEAGTLALKASETRISRLLKFVNDTFLPEASEKGIELRVPLPALNDKHITADEGRIRQVLLNMVGNAVKFTHKGYVEVTADIQRKNTGPNPEANKQYLVLTIKDTGIGIAEKDQQTIFAPFTQLSTGNSRMYEGTGLGLNIAQRLVELMNGEISLTSKPGVGSTFTVTIPVG
jgi:signal transduction histidine kinase